jgi:DnaJ-class molecular chaperone
MEIKQNKILQEIVELDEEQQEEVVKTGYECPDCKGIGKVYYIPEGSVGWGSREFPCGRCGGLGKILTRRIFDRRLAPQVEYLDPNAIVGQVLLFAKEGIVRVERRNHAQRKVDVN